MTGTTAPAPGAFFRSRQAAHHSAVRNTGNTTIEFAKAFMQFKDAAGTVVSAKDSYFSPHDIPPGSIASADVYSEGSGAHSCALTAVQDGSGRQATLSQ